MEPLTIGENVFPEAVSLPPEVRDAGILEFPQSGRTAWTGPDGIEHISEVQK